MEDGGLRWRMEDYDGGWRITMEDGGLRWRITMEDYDGGLRWRITMEDFSQFISDDVHLQVSTNMPVALSGLLICISHEVYLNDL